MKRRTPVGSLILRGSHAERFRTDDQLIELEMYPRFRPGTYAYVAVGAGVQRTPTGSFLSIEPAPLDGLLRGVQQALEATPQVGHGKGAVLLSGQAIRAPLHRLLARALPRVAVLSHNELPPDVKVVAAGRVELADAR